MAAPVHVTKEEIRRICGITVTEISDADVDDMASDREFIVEKALNATFIPRRQIDRISGNNRNIIFTKKGPLLAVRQMEVQDTTITIANVQYERSGKIRLTTDAEQRIFIRFPRTVNAVLIDYVYGQISFPESAGTETTSDAASVASTSTVLSVVSETGFAVDDWIQLEGMDGNREAAKVTATAAGSITVDQTLYAHESGSLVRKLELQEKIKQLIRLETCLAMIARETGQSFDDITGYTIGERQVQKGEPFTQWREAWKQIFEEWKRLKRSVHAFPALVVR